MAPEFDRIKASLRHWIDRSGGLDDCSDFWWAKTNACSEEDIRRLKAEVRKEAADIETLKARAPDVADG